MSPFLFVISCLFIAKSPRQLTRCCLTSSSPDHGMPRGQALAGIGEALQKSAERLKARGFQTRMQPAAGAFKTKLLDRRGRDDSCARW